MYSGLLVGFAAVSAAAGVRAVAVVGPCVPAVVRRVHGDLFITYHVVAVRTVEYLHTDGSKEQLTFIRTTLVAMKLSRDELEHPIRSLSGGQKAKVLLLKLILAHPSVLIMDEPTRNLSPLSAPVMRDVICTFPGAVLCVTHDRILIQDGLVTVKA